MSNFLKFIEDDIQAKRTLFSTMPTKTKRDIKKYNEKIDQTMNIYEGYRANVKKYLEAKSRSFNIKCRDVNLEKLKKHVSALERVRFLLNPLNTYFEKMGFDNLIYQISNYADFDFKSLNDIINSFLDKFEQAGIKLTGTDFDYTCYVHEYMVSFLKIKNNKDDNYDQLSAIFEKIYWVNPEIIEHIELNFRKLIKKYERKFTNYIHKHQKDTMLENKINNYEECMEGIKIAHAELNKTDKENICDIINLAKTGVIDINNYFEDSKTRNSNYSALMIDSLHLDNKEAMTKFYENLTKLKTNIEEYSNYLKFEPLFEDFKKEYEKLVPAEGTKANVNNTALKNIESQIKDKEAKLDKFNKRIFNDHDDAGFLEHRSDKVSKYLIDASLKQAKDLYDLYKSYDQEYFKNKVLSILHSAFKVNELLHLYYSFDYFKKMAIKKVFNLTTYADVVRYSDDFDLFAMNPNNIVINSIPLFEEYNIAKIIINRYRLDNINLTEENLNPNDLKTVLDKIQFLLRINEIEKSPTSVEKIWFMAQVEKINIMESKKE